jgi:hypothetical protein
MSRPGPPRRRPKRTAPESHWNPGPAKPLICRGPTRTATPPPRPLNARTSPPPGSSTTGCRRKRDPIFKKIQKRDGRNPTYIKSVDVDSWPNVAALDSENSSVNSAGSFLFVGWDLWPRTTNPVTTLGSRPLRRLPKAESLSRPEPLATTGDRNLHRVGESARLGAEARKSRGRIANPKCDSK